MTRPRRAPRRIAAVVAAALSLAAVPLLHAPSTSGAFSAVVRNTGDTAASASAFSCPATFDADGLRDKAYFEYALTDATSVAKAPDASAAGNPGIYQGTRSVNTASPIACPGPAASAWQLNGTDSWLVTSNPVGTSPATFSVVVWFKAPRLASRGGYLLGLCSNQQAGGNYDRHLYVDSTGLLEFGTYSGGTQTLHSKTAVDDGRWHQAVGTMSPTAGMALYLDGVLQSSNSTWTTAENDAGWWTLGRHAMSGWENSPSNEYFTGSMRYAAAYKVVLDASEVAAEYRNGLPG